MSKICDVLISFAEVFAAMSPWLVAGFLAAMMAYNLVRPVRMGHANTCKCDTSKPHSR